MSIDDHLLGRAQELAARSDRSLDDVVSDGLRLLLTERASIRPDAVDLPVFGGGGLQPGVDLEDTGALAAMLDSPDHDRADR